MRERRAIQERNPEKNRGREPRVGARDFLLFDQSRKKYISTIDHDTPHLAATVVCAANIKRLFLLTMTGGYVLSRLPRPQTPPGIPPPDAARTKSKLSYGVVCSSNINRSMQAHIDLGNAGTLNSPVL
jgi:hypothetical protein